ncbi:MAG: D-alanine--D-alanine ligase [Deltaproteobacteria bacterium]|nr:D-alanine--D-alanine ligase [Deltaproteobacteria bacterium]MBW2419350.1 D-alanine--D-alanine ligase [Deltaproteobacteria bacterium]
MSTLSTRTPPGPAPLRIGIVFETFETYSRRRGDPGDYHVEYEPESTVEVIEAAFEQLGHRPLRLGSPLDLLGCLGRGELPPLDAALSIAEGYGSRNREAWAPNLLEMAGIPILGSDAFTLTLSLDKAWANAVVSAAGVPVAPQCVVGSPEELDDLPLPAPFPLFVKPRWEGSSKGIRASSRVESREELAREVARVTQSYSQPALVEAFVPGAEYTVTVVGNAPPRALPALQRALDPRSGVGLHAVEGVHAGVSDAGRAPDDGAAPGEREHALPGSLTGELESRLQELALRAYVALECLDFARADFRLDAAGEPLFLEINPLPTFAVDGSFGILAELEGRPLEALLAEVFAGGLARMEGGSTGGGSMAGGSIGGGS